MSSLKRTLVTGGTGFVGASLARRLVRSGCDVHVLAHHEDQTWRIDSIRKDIRVHTGDLCDRASVDRLVAEARPDWVFHCAVYGAYSWQESLDRMARTNVVGTLHLLEACREASVESFVHTGTSSEYGYKDHPPREDEALEPNSGYAVTKASATMLVRWFAQESGMHLTTLRLYSVYGPYEDPGRLFPTLIRAGLAGLYPPLVHPDVARDFVSTDDVYRAYVLAASRERGEPGAVYNVGSGTQTTMREVVALAARLLQIPGEPVWGSMPERRWDTNTWVADPRRIRLDLGWAPVDSLESGLSRMIEWSRDVSDGLQATAGR
jgi:nucleoside-diphosphate-sugar epimerase